MTFNLSLIPLLLGDITVQLDLIIAFCALLVSMIALCGDVVRHKIYPPKLRLSLRSTTGVYSSDLKSRYYHLAVTNERSLSPARGVVVMIDRIWRKSDSGTWEDVYRVGPVPLQWQYHRSGESAFDIGRERFCDLGELQKPDGADKGGFAFCTVFKPADFPKLLPVNEQFLVKLFAEGDNAKRSDLLVDLEWDGHWSDDDRLIAGHLRVNVSCGPPPD